MRIVAVWTIAFAGLLMATPGHLDAQRRTTREAAPGRQRGVPQLVVDSTCRLASRPRPASAKSELLVDVVFHTDRDSAGMVPRRPRAGQSAFGPTREQIRAVHVLSARVLYQFAVPGVRVRVPAESLPALERLAAALLVVPEPRRHDVEVVVSYPSWPDDSPRGDRVKAVREQEWKQVGGRVLEPFPESAAYLGVLPDAGLRRLLTTHPGLRARWVPGGCLGPSYDLHR